VTQYVGVLQKLVDTVSPWFIRGRNIGTFLQSVALTYDDEGETLHQGLRLSQPLTCDASALPVLSRDRGIRIYPNEPEASRRYRLSRWKQIRRQFGTHQGELRNLQPYFLPAVPLMRIVHQDGNGGRATWHTLDSSGAYTVHKATPSNWDYDGATPKYSRWWAIIYREAAMGYPDPAEYDGGETYNGGPLWDGGPSTAQIADIVDALREAKGAHSKLWGVIVTSEPNSFNPSADATIHADGWSSHPIGNWLFPIDNTTGLPSRPPYASWIYDVGLGVNV